MDEVVVAKVRVKICTSGKNSWKVAEDTDPADQIHELDVDLEIQGNKRSGYHLVVSPEGCFTADSLSHPHAKDGAGQLANADTAASQRRGDDLRTAAQR